MGGRVFISAAHKSSGKTTVSIGLAASLAARGLDVRAFKKGPDYIDPLWLERASGHPVYNLDFNTQEPAEIRALYAARQSASGIDIIEGNKGLHDGVDLAGSDSSAALAKVLDAPVVLVIDTTGVTRGIAPLLMGYQAFDPEVRIGGIILNQVATARQESKLRAAVERYLKLPVLGALPRSPAVIVKERHLGLTTPGDEDGPEGRIARIRGVIEANVDVDAILALARTAAPIAAALPVAGTDLKDVSIGVAMDAAFCFYYRDDLEALEAVGARLVPFSPLADAHLPDVDGLFIGGGFPETHMDALAANASLRADIRRVAEAGMPIRAECGGLMYLSNAIVFDGMRGPMVGVVDADAVMHTRPQGRGLVVLREDKAGPCDLIPAHEFHYARLENLAAGTRFAWRIERGEGIDGTHDGVVAGNVVASFSHFRDTSKFRWARDFVDLVRRTKAARAPRPAPLAPLAGRSRAPRLRKGAAPSYASKV